MNQYAAIDTKYQKNTVIHVSNSKYMNVPKLYVDAFPYKVKHNNALTLKRYEGFVFVQL